MLQGKVELLNMHCTLRSTAAIVHHFKISESNVSTTENKEIEWSHSCSYTNNCILYILENSFLSQIENVLYGCRFAVGKTHQKTLDMIWEKVKSLHDNLKQKEDEESKGREFNASKWWFNNFERKLPYKISR